MAGKSSINTVLLMLLAAAGCQSAASLSTWKAGVERYVADRGDPSALRDVTVQGTRPGFAVIGGIDPKKSTDVKGVLLGHKSIDNRPWFIYLVGLVARQKVTDIHLAAVTFADGKPRWAVSGKDGHAVSIYRRFNEGLWRQKHPNSKPPSSDSSFPRDADAFELTGDGTKVSATHPPSGATWTVDVAKRLKR